MAAGKLIRRKKKTAGTRHQTKAGNQHQIITGQVGLTVLLVILTAGFLTGCSSRENDSAEGTELISIAEDVQSEADGELLGAVQGETEASSPLPSVVPAVMPAAPFPTVPPDAPVRTDGIDGSFGIGSASVLRGKNILVSLFLTTPDNAFTEEEKEICLQRLKEAAIYIEETASGYGVETRFILDWSEENSQDLCMEKTVDFSISDDSDFMDALDEAFAQWTEEELSYERLLQEYGADGIATCMFVNAPGRSYAIVYDGEDNVRESLVMFVRNDKGTEEEPAVYAHEILHVFGAHDLYRGEEYSRAVTDYIAANYPDEIMRSVAGEGRISEQISRITAYHLGWIDEIPETESFPELIR